MAKKLGSIVCIDLEATCWMGTPPEGQQSEIIEIGVCELMQSGSILRSESIVVKPKLSLVSEFCTQLTGWTQEKLDAQGIDIKDALDILEDKYELRDRLMASWGDYDRLMILKAALFRFPAKDPIRTHLNVKNLFAMKHYLKKECPLDDAVRMAGLRFLGRHHSGVDDARNVAMLTYGLLHPENQRPATFWETQP